MPDNDQKPADLSEYDEAAKRSQEAGVADETAAYDLAADKDSDDAGDDGSSATDGADGAASGVMAAPEHTGSQPLSDEDVVALAQAEQNAGVPDMQTAEAAAAAKERIAGDGEAEAHPS